MDFFPEELQCEVASSLFLETRINAMDVMLRYDEVTGALLWIRANIGAQQSDIKKQQKIQKNTKKQHLLFRFIEHTLKDSRA